LFIFSVIFFLFIVYDVHIVACIGYARASHGRTPSSVAIVSAGGGRHDTGTPPMVTTQHAVPAIDAIIDNEEIIVPGEAVFVYAVQTALERSTAETVATRDKTLVLHEIRAVNRSRGRKDDR
jgi:hypothetical protein